MTKPYLTLQHLAFAWPDGQQVFSHIDMQLDQRHTGLVGRNGVGKSVLARVLTGELRLQADGACVRAEFTTCRSRSPVRSAQRWQR